MSETQSQTMTRPQDLSLSDINSTVEVPEGHSFWKTLLAYSGPGALVAVGYMDPGNWSTSITGGQNFQYLLLSIIVISSLLAMLLQNMAAKLGIVCQLDLAQAIRARTSRRLGFIFWILTELAIMATDIAEVIGAAIALYLLFKIPIFLAVVITVLDVFLLLLLNRIGFRKIEALVVCLIFVILFVFLYQIILSQPAWHQVAKGLIPSWASVQTSPKIGGQTPLSASLGIIGATIMPANLFLHSAISQSRKIDRTDSSKVAEAVRFSNWDSNIQLSLAMVVNALLLIMGVAVFKSGAVQDPSFFGLYQALSNPDMVSNPVLAEAARSGVLSTLFAVALLASGQNSTITGTITGQVIMEGFIHLRLPLWLRRLVTRLIAIIPVVVCVAITSHQGSLDEHQALNNLMNNSQVFLALALPFSIVPLLMLTDSAAQMGNQFKNTRWVKVMGWLTVIILTLLNLISISSQIAGFFGDNPSSQDLLLSQVISIGIILAMIGLLIWTIIDIRRFTHPKQKALEVLFQ
uniref:Divalent metal cation transporter MntH n=1 Tax=Eremococcus coleocola ACS-139-V-Col8 TaxID=908337 RepID=UPI00094DFD84|nr:Chain A, Divalent metal cation transporter MntH [Eremococcus coleocola ACS-139-V-Col8]